MRNSAHSRQQRARQMHYVCGSKRDRRTTRAAVRAIKRMGVKQQTSSLSRPRVLVAIGSLGNAHDTAWVRMADVRARDRVGLCRDTAAAHRARSAPSAQDRVRAHCDRVLSQQTTHVALSRQRDPIAKKKKNLTPEIWGSGDGRLRHCYVRYVVIGKGEQGLFGRA